MSNKGNSTEEVIRRVQTQPDILPFAKLVGRWVWVEFQSKPGPAAREFLKAEGFIWNRKRSAWQHCCGYRSFRGINPKGKYGEINLKEAIQ